MAWKLSCTRRPPRKVVILVGILFFVGSVHLLSRSTAQISKTLQFVDSKVGLGLTTLPPLYEMYHEYERNLPQQNPSLPAPEGKHAKYLYTANYITHWQLGWGNILEEIIMNAQLAYATKRGWVFDNFTWDRGTSEYAHFKMKVIPSRIPLSAFLSGPMVGGEWEDEADKAIPRAVTPRYFRQVCSKEETVVLDSIEMSTPMVGMMGADILKTYVDKINSIDARCIEISGRAQLFDVWLFGSKNIHSLWPEMSNSPILKQLGFSPLIIGAYLTNQLHFVPPKYSPDLHPATLSKQIPGLMVLHVRRGDYAVHCHSLALYRSQYLGWNSFSEFPDHLEETGNLPGEVDDGKWRFKNVYQKHCYPSIGQIVARVNEIRKAHHAKAKSEEEILTRVYIMSNGKRDWLKELKKALHASAGSDGWESISTSRDLVLTPEQQYVSQQVDVYIGTRATVFVGVGFSSLTSAVVTLRKTHELDPMTSRFW